VSFYNCPRTTDLDTEFHMLRGYSNM